MKIIPPDYISIPYQVLVDPKINPTDRVLYGFIYWFTRLKMERCTASNATFAELLQVEAGTVQNGLSRLENQGYIQRIFKDKEKRIRLEIIPLIAFGKVSLKKGTLPPNNDTWVPPNNDQNKSNINKSIKVNSVSDETAQQEELTLEEPPKETYKTKKKIFEQKGLEYTPPKRSTLQERQTSALLLIDYFKDRAFFEHRLQYFKSPSDKNGKIRNLAKNCYDRFGSEAKAFIDWYLEGEGEWCNYEPDQCFSSRMYQRYENKDVVEAKGEAGGVVDLVEELKNKK